MPKLAEVRQQYTQASAKTREIIRQLAFAGFALIWIFKEQAPTGELILDKHLVRAGFVLVLALAFDLVAAIEITSFLQFTLKKAEALQKREDEDIGYMKVGVVLASILNNLEIILVAAGYFILLSFLGNRFL